MIEIELKPEIENRLAAQAESCGLALSDYLHGVLVERAERTSARTGKYSVSQSVDRIRELRAGNYLGDLEIKDLIREGRKY